MVSETMYALGSKRSCIRELFEYGLRQAKIVGKENVYDFSIGNPSIPSPPEVNEAFISIVRDRDSLSVQLEKRSQALKTLYLDRVAGILSEGQFVELNQSFLEEKSRLERRLNAIDEELAERDHSEDQDSLMERARELLKLETVPRELVVGLVEKIEICEKNLETGQQEVKVTWKF